MTCSGVIGNIAFYSGYWHNSKSMKSRNVGLAVLMMAYFLRFEPADGKKYSLEYLSRRVHVLHDFVAELINKILDSDDFKTFIRKTRHFAGLRA